MLIRIEGTYHAIKKAGMTQCGLSYPPAWNHSAGSTTDCDHCLRIREAQIKALLEREAAE
ncbi:MAG: hypothetical protein Q7O66_16830 [Dehalococcoidia bacterium]|nr:hypothetical protein [Dehalococcoidia bacterium]